MLPRLAQSWIQPNLPPKWSKWQTSDGISHSWQNENTTDIHRCKRCQNFGMVVRDYRQSSKTWVWTQWHANQKPWRILPRWGKRRTKQTEHSPTTVQKRNKAWEQRTIHHFAFHISNWFQCSCLFKGEYSNEVLSKRWFLKPLQKWGLTLFQSNSSLTRVSM